MVNYTIARVFLLTALLGIAKAFDEWEHVGLSVVLRGEQSVNGANDETRFYFGDRCDIDFPPDGSLRAGIFGSEGLWHVDFAPNQASNSLCTPPVRYKLQSDGNFIITCQNDNTLDYMTHSHQGETGDYFMAVDNGCELHIFRGTFGCDELDIHEEVWASHKYGPWEINDRLYKGQVYHGLSWYDMILGPDDGDLDVRYPGSHGTYDIVWKSSDEWDAPPGEQLHDFYAKLTPGGRLLLVGIDYSGDSLEEEVYFAKDLNSGGADCYMLGYESLGEYPEDPIDLIAVPCEGN